MNNLNHTPTYNLKAVVQETGLKPDTLRAWERRYNLPRPQRTPSGHRLYSQQDIHILNWLIARQREGVNISRAVALWHRLEAENQEQFKDSTTNTDLSKQSSQQEAGATSEPSSHIDVVDKQHRVDPKTEQYVSDGLFNEQVNSSLFNKSVTPSWLSTAKEQLSGHETVDLVARLRNEWMAACMSFDEQAAENALSQAFALFPPETVCLELLQKGLAQIGADWHNNKITVQQEHFASELAHRRLEALIAMTPHPVRPSRLLIGCPPLEEHTFPPLILALLLRRRGWDVVYLGANVPIQNLESTLMTTKPDLVILSAQQLHTAANLLEMAEFLGQRRVPMAFGGLIFTQLPELHRTIPGYFLGKYLKDATQTVEQILISPRPQVALHMVSDNYKKAAMHFQECQAKIEAELWQVVDKIGLSPKQLLCANRRLGRDIYAALALGDISFLKQSAYRLMIPTAGMDTTGSKVESQIWLDDLLGKYCQIPQDKQGPYLQTYLSAVERHLDQRGEILVQGFDTVFLSKK